MTTPYTECSRCEKVIKPTEEKIEIYSVQSVQEGRGRKLLKKYHKECWEKKQNEVISIIKDDFTRKHVNGVNDFEKKDKHTNSQIYTTVKCQVCGKNDVQVIKNHPYFGVICSECSKIKSFTI